MGSHRWHFGEQIWRTLSGGGAGLARGPTERPGWPTHSQARVTTPGGQLRTPAPPRPVFAGAEAQPRASRPGPIGPPTPVRHSGRKLSTPCSLLGWLLCPVVGLEPRTRLPGISEPCRSGPAEGTLGDSTGQATPPWGDSELGEMLSRETRCWGGRRRGGGRCRPWSGKASSLAWSPGALTGA